MGLYCFKVAWNNPAGRSTVLTAGIFLVMFIYALYLYGLGVIA
jgi:hypothetical protein